MGRFGLDRDFYIPKNSTKVAHKSSDAVAYVYTNGAGKPAAALFSGRAAKPVTHCWYGTAKRREGAITQFFKNCHDHADRVAQRRTDRKTDRAKFAEQIAVGDIFVTCWGYDETHYTFVEVTKVSGMRVETRELMQEHTNEGADFRYSATPIAGKYRKPAEKHTLQDGYLKIGRHAARKWDGRPVRGGGSH